MEKLLNLFESLRSGLLAVWVFSMCITASACPPPCQAADISRMVVESSSFPSNGLIPKKYTADAEDTSPLLRWKGVPKEAQSICLICHDPDAPNKNWVHWVAYDIPVDISVLPEGASRTLRTFKQGINDFKKSGWNGPAPPPGKIHHYIFDVFALNTKLGDLGSARDVELKQRIAGHVIAAGQLVGLYKR